MNDAPDPPLFLLRLTAVENLTDDNLEAVSQLRLPQSVSHSCQSVHAAKHHAAASSCA